MITKIKTQKKDLAYERRLMFELSNAKIMVKINPTIGNANKMPRPKYCQAVNGLYLFGKVWISFNSS